MIVQQPRVSLGASVDSHTNPLAAARDLRTQRPIGEFDLWTLDFDI